MPQVRKKAKENLDAAQRLIESKMYSSSIHCSYYSCLLRMKYILDKHKTPFTYDKQNDLNGESCHNRIILEIINRIERPTLSRKIRTSFEVLKKDRVLADYREKNFNELESLTDRELAVAVQANLKQAFGEL